MKKYGDMTKAVKVEFLRNVSFFCIVHGCSLQKKRFKQNFPFFYTKFSSYPSAKQFIHEKLDLKIEKSVAFYTRLVFTAGQTSSQRSKSMNNLFKGFGSLKKEMV